MDKEWKSIPLIEGIGEVSKDGWFKYYNYKNTGKEKITRGKTKSDGHLCVYITKSGVKLEIGVHRLMALAFKPIPEKYKGIPLEKLDVHHKDFNKQNNSLDNLEWLTKAEHRRLHSSVPIEMCTLDWEHEEYFPSINEAGRKTKIGGGNILRVLQGVFKQTKGHRFRYANPN